MAEVFTNKRNLRNFAKKAGVDMPSHRMDKPSLLLHIAETLAVREMNKQFSLGDGDDATFIERIDKMDRKDRMCTQKQYTAQGTITKIQVDQKDVENKRTHYRPTKAQLANHEKRFKAEEKVSSVSNPESNSMQRAHSAAKSSDIGQLKAETKKKKISMPSTIMEDDAPDKLNSSDFIKQSTS